MDECYALYSMRVHHILTLALHLSSATLTSALACSAAPVQIVLGTRLPDAHLECAKWLLEQASPGMLKVVEPVRLSAARTDAADEWSTCGFNAQQQTTVYDFPCRLQVCQSARCSRSSRLSRCYCKSLRRCVRYNILGMPAYYDQPGPAGPGALEGLLA